MRLILSALLLGAVMGCVPKVTPQSAKYQHDGFDKATEPIQADFVAPHGGYLFPFQDMMIEVTFRRDTIVDAYVYDREGKPVHLDDRMKVAGLEASVPGFSHSFIVQMGRGGSLNHFHGKTTLEDINEIERAMSIKFSFVLPDPNNNYTRRQCHEGHWSVATPKVQEMAVSRSK